MAPPIPETGSEMAMGVITAIAAFLTISIFLGFFMRKKRKFVSKAVRCLASFKCSNVSF